MTFGLVFVTLIMITPATDGFFRSPAVIQELGRFDTLENCKFAMERYKLYARKAEFFCAEGALSK